MSAFPAVLVAIGFHKSLIETEFSILVIIRPFQTFKSCQKVKNQRHIEQSTQQRINQVP